MRRARGGLTAKIHALVDALARPVRLKLTEGQTLLADRAHDSHGLRNALAERGAVANIRLMLTRKRLPAFDPILYRQRNQVERFFSKIQHFRAVAARYGKRDDNFLASVQLASIRIWRRTYEPVT